MVKNNGNDKLLESWIWAAVCSIRGTKEAPKYKGLVLPLFFTKHLCDLFDDGLNRIAGELGGRARPFDLTKRDKKLTRFFCAITAEP